MSSYAPKSPQNQDNSWLGPLFIWTMVILLLLAVGMCSLTSCSTIRYIDREVVVHDTTQVSVRDSVTFYDRDSIFVKEKGDTVYKYVEKWRYRDRWHTDTLVRVRIDSVAVYQDRIVEVEKPLSAWRKFQIRGFWYLLGGLALAVAVWLLKKRLKL